MKEFYRKVIRASGRISDILVFTAILCFVVSILGAFPGQLIINCLTPFLEKLAGNEGAADFLGRYLNTIGAWIAGLLFIAIFRKNHPMFKSLAYKKEATISKTSASVCCSVSGPTGSASSSPGYRETSNSLSSALISSCCLPSLSRCSASQVPKS